MKKCKREGRGICRSEKGNPSEAVNRGGKREGHGENGFIVRERGGETKAFLLGGEGQALPSKEFKERRDKVRFRRTESKGKRKQTRGLRDA